jgi:hypothetical protein
MGQEVQSAKKTGDFHFKISRVCKSDRQQNEAYSQNLSYLFIEPEIKFYVSLLSRQTSWLWTVNMGCQNSQVLFSVFWALSLCVLGCLVHWSEEVNSTCLTHLPYPTSDRECSASCWVESVTFKTLSCISCWFYTFVLLVDWVEQDRESYWKMMHKYIGSDITSMVTLPVIIFEPMTMLQKMAEVWHLRAQKCHWASAKVDN